MSKLNTLIKWVGEYKSDEGCYAAVLVHYVFDTPEENPKHKQFDDKTLDVCQGLPCDNCLFIDSGRILNNIKELRSGITHADPNSPF